MYSAEEASIRAKNCSRFKKFKELKSDYEFSVEINTLDDFLLYGEEKITVKHIRCRHKEVMTLNEFMQRRCSFHRYKKFYKEENDYKCSKCTQRAKNKYFQNELKTKHDSKFVLVSDFIKKDKPIKIKHTKCGEVFEINPSNYYSNKIVCKKCKKVNELNEKFDEKLKELDLHKKYKRMDDINSNDEVVRILHQPCKSILEFSPNKFFHKKNKCPKCSFKKAVGRKLSNEYTLLSDYTNLASYVELKHNKCGHTFEIRVDNFLISKRRCPKCEKDDRTSMYASLSERKTAYEKELNFEYEILSPILSHASTVEVRHKKCGTVFKRRASGLNLKRRDVICPTCIIKEREGKFVKDLKEKHGDNFELIGGFKKLQSLAEFKHNKCESTFKEFPYKLLKRNEDYCPNCSDNIYTTDSLRKKVFSATNGEYILVGEYVNAKTKVRIRHVKCGRVFTVFTYVFFNSIKNNVDSLACKHCMLERKRLGVQGLQNKLKAKFGNLFSVHGVYRNAHTAIPIQCNHCKTIKNVTPRNILTRKGCSVCKKTYL